MPMDRFYRNTRMEGTTFQTDSTRVHQIIMNCLSDIDAYPRVAKQQVEGSCGRKLLTSMALSDHYYVQVSMVIRAQQHRMSHISLGKIIMYAPNMP
jgi:hypothetical protein